MNVAVTGSHGYIGSVLRKTLTELGHDVYACDNKPLISNLNYLKTIATCSFDDDQYVSMVVMYGCKTIFHLAASSLLGPSATDPLLYYQNNTARTINLIKKLADRGWKGRIVFSSTAAVYGDQLTGVVTENSPLQPCNFYGKSKLACEEILSVAHMYGIDVTIFRYFNVAGAYDDMGQESGEPHLITRICNAAAGRNPLTVYGDDYPTEDGTCIRDYVHVRDICNAQIYAMDNQINGTFNLGTFTGTSVKEIISGFIDVNRINVEYEIGKRREGDPTTLIAYPYEYTTTGFKYKHSQLDNILQSAWEYFKNGI